MHGLPGGQRPSNDAGIPQIFQPAVPALLLATVNGVQIPVRIGFEHAFVGEKHLRCSARWNDAMLTGPDLINNQRIIPLVGHIVNPAQGKQRPQLQFHRGCAVTGQQGIAQNNGVLPADHLHAFFDRPTLPLVRPSRERFVTESAQGLIPARVNRIGIFVARQRRRPAIADNCLFHARKQHHSTDRR